MQRILKNIITYKIIVKYIIKIYIFARLEVR